MLKDGCWGSGGKRFASYSEGVVDTLCGYVEGVDKFFDHPIQTTCNAVGQLILDPAKPIREMSVNMALAIHNRDWDSVAYQVGGLTTHTAVIGTTYMATSGIPSSINVKIPKISTAALTNGKTALVVSTATARVSTAGAVSIGKAAAGVNVLYSKSNKKSNSDNEYHTPRNNQAQNRQVDEICNKLGLNAKQRRMVHNEISHQGYDYWDIYEIAEYIKNNSKGNGR